MIATRNTAFDTSLGNLSRYSVEFKVLLINKPQYERLGKMKRQRIILSGRVRAPVVFDLAVLGLEGQVEEVGKDCRQKQARGKPKTKGLPECGREQSKEVVGFQGPRWHSDRVDRRNHEQDLLRQKLVEQTADLDENSNAFDRRSAADAIASLVDVLRYSRCIVSFVHPRANLDSVAIDLVCDIGR